MSNHPMSTGPDRRAATAKSVTALATLAIGIASRTAVADSSFFVVDPDARSPRIRPSVTVGAGLVVISESLGARSPVHFGGQLSAAAWSHRLGISLEGGMHTWSLSGHGSWLGTTGRLALVDGEHRCQPRTISLFGCSEHSPTLAGRVWLELGVAREWWQIGAEATGGAANEVERSRYSAGLGVDAGTTHVQGSVFLRLHRAVVAGDDSGAPDTSLVLGTGFVVGR